MFEEISGILSAFVVVFIILLFIYRNYIKYLRKQIEKKDHAVEVTISKINIENDRKYDAMVKQEKEKYDYLETIIKLLAYQLPTLFGVASEVIVVPMDYANGFELHFAGPSFSRESFPRMFYRFFANRESRPELHVQLTDNQVFNDIFSRAFEEKFKGNGQMDLLETEIIIAQSFCPDTVKEVCEVYRIANEKYQRLISNIETESE